MHTSVKKEQAYLVKTKYKRNVEKQKIRFKIWNPATYWIRNPQMWNPESKDTESGIHSAESRIQDSLGIPYMGRTLNREKQCLVWRQMPSKSFCPSMFRHLYPSRDEVLYRIEVNVLPQISRWHFIDDTSKLCSLHRRMHWSWSSKILHNLTEHSEKL